MTKRPTSASPASSRARGRSSTATKASTRSVWARPSAAQRALWSSIQARISVGRWGDWGGPCSGVHASRRSPRVASARETAARVPGARRQSLDRTRRAPVRSTMARRLSRSSGSNARGLGGGGGEGQQTVARLTTRRRTDGATVASEDGGWRDAPSGHQHPVHVEEEHFHRVSEPREGTSGANDPIGNVASRSRACAGGEGRRRRQARARAFFLRPDKKVHDDAPFRPSAMTSRHAAGGDGRVGTARRGGAAIDRTTVETCGRSVRVARGRECHPGARCFPFWDRPTDPPKKYAPSGDDGSPTGRRSIR